MGKIKLLSTLLLVLLACNGFSQACSTILGQNPASAIPVCGTTAFHQDGTASCTGVINIPHSGCAIDVTSDNSFWYKFHCYQTGTLGFIINGTIASADYDWEVFDITGHDPNDVLTDGSLQVSLNLYGVSTAAPPFPNYPTGCTAAGVGSVHCEGETNPFNEMPTIVAGHDYLLMVTNYLSTGTGYFLDFGGGTAVITDPVTPAILSASSSCDNLHITVKLNKKMKCNTLAADGSDFKLDYAGTTIIGAASAACSFNFDTDSLILTLSSPLPTGTYQVIAQNGTDANTMLDYCDNPIPVNNAVTFNIISLGTAAFSFSGSNCVNSPITFTDASTPVADLMNWHWDLGDGTILDNNNNNPFTHAYLTSGTFTVTLVVTNRNSCTSAVFSRQVTIKDLPSATIAGATTVCVNAASPVITFTGSGGTPPYTFSYSINGVAQSPVISNGVGVYTMPVPTTPAGTYVYAITNVQESSSSQCAKDLNAVSTTVIVNPLPEATITGTTEVCKNAATPFVTFTGSGGTPPYIFNYTFNGTPLTVTTTVFSNTVTVAVPTTATGVYTFILQNVTESSSTTCTQLQSGTVTITVNALPVPSFTNSTPACDTYAVNFTDGSTISGNTITGWSWNFGDPASGAANTSAQQNPSHIFSAAGTYTVTLNVTTDKGCSAATVFSRQVTVNNQPQADFIIPKVCLNDTYAQFTDASVIAAPSTISWLWDFGDANATPGNPNTSTQQNPKHSYTATGNYVVTLTTTSNNGCVSTVQHNVFVNGSFPKAIFNVTDEATLCVNKPVTITNTSTVFPGTITKLEIFWDDVNAPTVVQTDNSPFIGSTYTHLYPDFNTPASQTINIHVRAYSGGVCTSDSVHSITLYASPKLQFTNIPDTCLLAAPYQLTQATELAGVPGTGVFTGTGVSSTGIFSPQVAGVGTHIITYTYTSTAGCTATAVNSIKVLDTVSAKFTYVIPACDKQQVIFNDGSSVPAGISNASTVWDFGDGSAIETHPAGAPFGHVFPTWGTYTVKMYTITTYGCNSTVFTKEVIIHPVPRPGFTFPASVCLPFATIPFINTSTIADGSENSFTYLWNFDDPASGINNSSVAKDPVHVYVTTGPFNVNLQVTSNYGCTHDTTIVLDVIHPQPKATFTTSRKTACLGEDILFINTTDPLQGGTASFHWNMGDNINTDLNVPTVDYIYLDTLTYRVSLYIVNGAGCNSDTAYRDMKVYPNPVVDAGPDRVVLEGTTLKMKPVVQAVEPQYLWSPNIYFKDGVNTILAPAAINIINDITYTLQVFGRGGCMRMDQVYIKVLKNPIIPNTFTPNGDGINEKWEITYLKDFPNSRVQVFTRAGQKVFESEGYGKPWDGKYKGKPLPFDTYYYIIEPGSGHDPLTGYVTILK